MSHWPAFDHTMQAMAGMSWSGRDDDVPSQGRAFSVDCFTGYVAFAQILGALMRRERSGEGQYIDVAMLDASLVLLAVGSVRQLITGDDVSAAQPIVHDRPTVAAYRTRDGWIWLSANFPHQFEALCRVLHAGDLLADARFSSARARTEHSSELKAELARRLVDYSAAELEVQLMEAGCPAARVRTTREALQMPILRDREMLQRASVPGREEPVTLMNAGFVADDDGPAVQNGIPELGADTAAVLGDLGYSVAEITRLRENGAI
jgi:crotonobetainyl-CoA:carnitine CoA-transferase CaiB-like acyl-CoA transferase